MAQDQRRFYVIIAAVVVAGGIFIVTRMKRGPQFSLPATAVVTAADTAGFHGYVIGSPSAPVEITEYADFQCPWCAQFESVQWPDVKQRIIDSGKARYRYRDYPLGGAEHQYGRLASHAAACADDQGKFWEVKSALFQRQTDWGQSKNPASIFREIVQANGVDVGKWNDCMTSAKYNGRIQASFEEGTRLGVSSTPTFFIGGMLVRNITSDGLLKLVDSIAATIKPGKPATPAPGE